MCMCMCMCMCMYTWNHVKCGEFAFTLIVVYINTIVVEHFDHVYVPKHTGIHVRVRPVLILLEARCPVFHQKICCIGVWDVL